MTREEFVQAVEKALYGITEEDVTETADTVEDFRAQWGEPDATEDTGLLVWEKIQTAKGKPRVSLFVYDNGEKRLAATC